MSYISVLFLPDKLEFLDIDMYYKYYLILHKRIIDTISYIVDEDMENEIDELEALLEGRKSRRAFAVIPTDW